MKNKSKQKWPSRCTNIEKQTLLYKENIKLSHTFEGPLRLSVVPQVLFLPLHLPSADLRWQTEETVLTFLLLIHADKACGHNSSWTHTCTRGKEQSNPCTHLCLQIGECLPTARVAFEVSLPWSGWGELECSVIVQLKMENQSERTKKTDKIHHCIILPSLTGFHELLNVLRDYKKSRWSPVNKISLFLGSLFWMFEPFVCQCVWQGMKAYNAFSLSRNDHFR